MNPADLTSTDAEFFTLLGSLILAVAIGFILGFASKAFHQRRP